MGLGSGSAIAGLYALKVMPDLIAELSKQIPQQIVITGTNGKSTTTRLVVGFAKQAGIKVITNPSGSNLERGIASSLVRQVNMFGRIKEVDLAIWELDEAAFRRIAGLINPEGVVILNVFRDQLDRYGEVDSIVKGWKEVLEKLPVKPWLVLNGDDTNVAELGSLNPKEVDYFGVNENPITGERKLLKKVKYTANAENIDLNGLDGSVFEVVSEESRKVINLPVGGAYQIYNFLAAYLTALRLGVDDKAISKALVEFKPIFGRVERLRARNGKELVVALIKNPVGATEVLGLIAEVIHKGDKLLIVLNDNFADGRDVSWIWDIDIEKWVSKLQGVQIVVSGTRAEEMMLRLKYANLDMTNISRENDLADALAICEIGSGRAFILPTYTALLTMERIFAKQGLRRNK